MQLLACLSLLLNLSLVLGYGQIPKQIGPLKPLAIKGHSRIVGGSEANPGDRPFQISLQDLNGVGHYCGGSIYDMQTIITSASCCDGTEASSMQVVAGEHNLYDDEGPEQTRFVSKATMHQNYDSFNVVNDICLLTLTESLVSDGEFVKSINLPSVQNSDPTGTARVSGWGSLSEGGASPDVLFQVDLPIHTDEVCRSVYGDSTIADSMMCAGGYGPDACQGDAGGPLTTVNGDTNLGIVSWGYGCGNAGYPGVYTQLSYYIDWIRSNS